MGVTLDSKLCWDEQVKKTKKKALERVAIIRRLSNQKSGLNQELLMMLYTSIVRPVLEYSSEVWGEITKARQVKLDSVLHRAITSSLGVKLFAKRRK